MLDPMRKALRTFCFSQLSALQASAQVWLIGDIDRVPQGFENIRTEGRTKEDKLWEVGERLADMKSAPAKYLVRLDDDDLINPKVFDALAAQDFDCCTDREHWFYEVSTALTGNQYRPWFPNTCIHAFKHGMARVPAMGGSAKAGDQNYLFACDHSKAWQAYYRDKDVQYSIGGKPNYLRIINKNSITAQNAKENSESAYQTYLHSFGSWKADFPLEASLKEKLIDLWRAQGNEITEYKQPKPSLIKKFKNLMNR